MLLSNQTNNPLNPEFMLYQMKLNDEPFERMKKGGKTLELRLFDEKRQMLELGDEIEFVRAANPAEKIRTKIFGLLAYNNFSDLIEDMPAAYLGYEESEKQYLKESMFEIYTKEEEKKYGVLGIRLRLADPDAEKK